MAASSRSESRVAGYATHHNGDCSFETILRRYQLDDPVLWRLAAIIHEAELDDERYEPPKHPDWTPRCADCR